MLEVVTRCQHKDTCRVPNTEDIWKKLNYTHRRCKEEDKPYLVNVYECRSKNSITICPGQGSKTIECPRDYVIEPTLAFFGRHNDLSCLKENEIIRLDRMLALYLNNLFFCF